MVGYTRSQWIWKISSNVASDAFNMTFHIENTTIHTQMGKTGVRTTKALTRFLAKVIYEKTSSTSDLRSTYL